MIAGDFDLSIGSTIGASGMATALLTVEYGWPVWAALAASCGLAILIGLVNGLVVIRTKLPSFIVTLAMLFIVRGSTIGITREITGRTQLGGVDGAAGYASAHVVFASSVSGFSIAIVWWLVLAAAATVVLQRTRFGHWILGAGRSADAARNLGVPVARVKVILFIATALAAWLISSVEVIQFTGADVLRGENREFEAIIA